VRFVTGSPPDGEPVPADGTLPPASRRGLGQRPFGIYVHVPFCVTRCGYCDFNTYTATELGPGATRDTYAGQAIAEIRLARAVLGTGTAPVSTVFFGGGTPTLLPPADLAAILAAIRAEFGLEPGERGPALPGRAARERLHPGLVRHAERSQQRA
jgi:oxygen-independent coproporphyrinogen-3 oxidase